MLMYCTVGTTSLTVPLGTYFLSFFSDSAANNQYAVAAVGSAFDLIVLAVAARGAGVSAKFQWVWAVFEYTLILGFCIAAIVGIYSGGLHHTVHIASTWFTIGGAGGFKALISGILLAIFLYSAWDTAAYVTEEARGKQAGRAAVTSVILLFVIYSVAVLAFQGIAPNGDMQANAGNILAFVGDKIGGGFWKNVMIVAVLGGTLASLQAAIVSSARISFAMGRDRVIPSWFGAVSEKYRTPWNATILLGLLNIVFLWASTLISSIGQALSDILSTLGLMAAIFYFLTAGTAVWYYRRQITSSAANFFLGGVLPAVGAAFMALPGRSGRGDGDRRHGGRLRGPRPRHLGRQGSARHRRRPGRRPRGRPVPDAPAGAGRGRAAARGLAESAYIGHTRTSAGGGGGPLAGGGPVGDAANASSHRRRRCRRHPRRHRRPLVAGFPRTARPGHHLGGRAGRGGGERVPRGLRRRRPVPAHRPVGGRPRTICSACSPARR